MVKINDQNQSGFGMVAGIIAAVVVIALLGIIGWRLYSQFKQNASATANTQTTSQTSNANQNTTISTRPTDPNAGYFVIKEWGVRFKLVSGLDGLSYTTHPSQRTNAVEAWFITDQLKSTSIPECNGTASDSIPLGAMVRTQTAEDLSQHLGSDQLLKQINGYYYYYYEPSQLCDPDPNSNTINDLQNNTLSRVKTSLASLEASK